MAAMQEIQARQSEINQLIAAGKNDEVATYYTDDCKVLAPGHEIVSGKEGIQKLSEAMKDLQAKVGKSETVVEEVFGEGDLVTARGKTTVYGKDGAVFLHTKSLSVWKKVGGKWLIQNHIWNTDKKL